MNKNWIIENNDIFEEHIKIKEILKSKGIEYYEPTYIPFDNDKDRFNKWSKFVNEKNNIFFGTIKFIKSLERIFPEKEIWFPGNWNIMKCSFYYDKYGQDNIFQKVY